MVKCILHLASSNLYFIILLLILLGNIRISGGMTFAGLTEASLQFTLTCISTGGPATTVTWTRDSDTVTEGTETVLDDPVTAHPDCDWETGRTLHMYCG